MIHLYAWPTPNCRKVSILLEELSVPYQVHSIDIGQDQQFAPQFLDISPNNKVPAIHDTETGVKQFESGAIMVYLSEKYGKFLPTDVTNRASVMQWLMWQMGGLGPMAGQGHHFMKFNPGASAYTEDRLKTEIARLYRVLNDQLADKAYIAGDYSIADMAIWPWVSRYEWHQVDLGAYPNVQTWYRNILKRDAVQRGYHIPHDAGPIPQG
ncbi:glutathione S-transferase family protein [Cognatishimia maritima]|uniref:Glutathione S-transferase n=1 Tax=Cognatishimia maritima TaxID=870908 RepID=A0A1M5QQR4_9RHOB|nr:glutathione S-transferase N-terminal domain-containing protein [Cognatishimia maritima]SHH16090.1 glutathione S-transferase [Cognatishimia maritima]